MSEMIERVARAILSKVPEGYGMTGAEAADYAREAIKSMRTPDDVLVATGAQWWEATLHAPHRGAAANAEVIWQAMLNKALEAE